MAIPLSKAARAPIEQIYRSVLKHHFLDQGDAPSQTQPAGRYGSEKVLPPHLGEMGSEIRYHLARAEPISGEGTKPER
jgi:hypothetical protein